MKIGTQIQFPRENGGKQKRKDIIRHNIGPIGIWYSKSEKK